MNLSELEQLFEKYEDEFLEFDKVTQRLSSRPDLHAFIILDNLVPSKQDMVSGATHDEIWLSVEPEDLAKVASEDDIKELIRCGLRYDSETESLAMFV